MSPKTFYHGTSIEAAFKIQETGFRVDLANAGALLGPGVYCTTTLEKALFYAKQHPHKGVIFELEIDLGRCKILKQGDPMMTTWQSKGYDSAWAPKGNDAQGTGSKGFPENCIKDPARIKIVNIIAGETGMLRRMGVAVKNGRLINTCNMQGCSRETWNSRNGEQCCRSCLASDGNSHGPVCNNNARLAKRLAGSPVNELSSKRARLETSEDHSMKAHWQVSLCGGSSEPPSLTSSIAFLLRAGQR
jgi:hypothetical protein